MMNKFVIFFIFLIGIATNLAVAGNNPEFKTGYARAIAWSPDSSQIIVIGKFNLFIHDAATLTPIKIFKPTKSPNPFWLHFPHATAAYSHDGKLLATANFDDGVIIWDTQTWQQLFRLTEAEGDTELVFSSDGKQLITAGIDSAISVFDTATGSKLRELTPSPSGVMSLATSLDGKLLVSGEQGQQIQIWDMATGKPVNTINEFNAPVLSVAISPDSQFLATFAGGQFASVLNVSNNIPASMQIDFNRRTSEQKIGTAIAAIFALASTVHTINITGAPTGFPVGGILSPPPLPNFYCPPVFSPDGKLLALIRISHELSSSYHVEVYESSTGTRISRNSGGGISAIAFSPDGNRLAVSGILGINILDPLSGKEIKSSPPFWGN